MPEGTLTLRGSRVFSNSATLEECDATLEFVAESLNAHLTFGGAPAELEFTPEEIVMFDKDGVTFHAIHNNDDYWDTEDEGDASGSVTVIAVTNEYLFVAVGPAGGRLIMGDEGDARDSGNACVFTITFHPDNGGVDYEAEEDE